MNSVFLLLDWLSYQGCRVSLPYYLSIAGGRIVGFIPFPKVIHHHHHHIVLAARISLTLSRHSSLSFIALGRSSGQHPVSSHSCWMYVRAGRPAFARPCVGIHKSTSLMSSSLLLQQCPACLVRLTWIDFVIGGRGSGHIDTAIWMHYMDANKTAREETRWQLHKNAACNPQQVLAAAPHKTQRLLVLCKQSCLGLEFRLPSPFPLTISITPLTLQT